MACNCPHCGKAIPIEVIEQMAFDYDPIELVTLPADVAKAAGLTRKTKPSVAERIIGRLEEFTERIETQAAADPAHDPGKNYANAETGKPLTMDEVFRAADTMMGTRQIIALTELAPGVKLGRCDRCRAEGYLIADPPDSNYMCCAGCICDGIEGKHDADAPTFLPK